MQHIDIIKNRYVKMGFIQYDRSQSNFLGYSVDDFAKADHKSHFVVDIVSRLNLKELYSSYSPQGGDSYAPNMMLALWFYAYSNGITSTRELEDRCKFDTRYMYISCNLQPDHTTLSRFRKSNLEIISKYFEQILLIALDEGLSDFRHITIDGTKIRSKSSGRHTYKEDQLNKKIEAIRKDIRYYMQRCDFVEQGASDTVDLETLRAEKKRLEDLEQHLIKQKELLQKRKENLKAEHREKHSINIMEPDARLMPKTTGTAYNPQVGVDVSTHLIVSNKVTTKPNDQGQFIPVQEDVEKNIGKDPQRSYTADAGYHNTSDLEKLEKNNVDAVIADPNKKNRSTKKRVTSSEKILNENRKVERNDFVFHNQENYYECPAGDKLVAVKNKGKKILYRASQCRECALLGLCVPSGKKLKQIHRSKKEFIAENMARKLETKEAKDRLKERAGSVEPVFGNLKQNLGFRRFSVSGLSDVQGEFNLMCIGHNLNVLFKMLQQRRFTASAYAAKTRLYQYITLSKNILSFYYYIFLVRYLNYQKNRAFLPIY